MEHSCLILLVSPYLHNSRKHADCRERGRRRQMKGRKEQRILQRKSKEKMKKPFASLEVALSWHEIWQGSAKGNERSMCLGRERQPWRGKNKNPHSFSRGLPQRATVHWLRLHSAKQVSAFAFDSKPAQIEFGRHQNISSDDQLINLYQSDMPLKLLSAGSAAKC